MVLITGIMLGNVCVLLFVAITLVSAAIGGVNQSVYEDLKAVHHVQVEKFLKFVHRGLCTHIYLDMGTNIGITIRKLYEPKYFPLSPLRWHLEEIFKLDGDPSIVCAAGWEPNSQHVDRLLQLQRSYQTVNMPVVIFTSTAVSVRNESVTFYRPVKSQKSENEAGASTIPWFKKFAGKIAEPALGMDISRFIHRVHSLWVSSKSYRPDHSKMVAKMDIEGAEYTVLPHLLAHGALCLMDEIFIEWHGRFLKETWLTANMSSALQHITEVVPNCNVSFLEIDDNTYGDGIDARPLLQSEDGSLGLLDF